MAKLGYHEVMLKCDGEAALRSVREEVKCLSEAPVSLDNSGLGDSQSNGAAEQGGWAAFFRPNSGGRNFGPATVDTKQPDASGDARARHNSRVRALRSALSKSPHV